MESVFVCGDMGRSHLLLRLFLRLADVLQSQFLGDQILRESLDLPLTCTREPANYIVECALGDLLFAFFQRAFGLPSLGSEGNVSRRSARIRWVWLSDCGLMKICCAHANLAKVCACFSRVD
jgi:hypothetical protein